MEYGFFHPDRGYWQTTSEVPEHILKEYPEGTQEVPLKPSSEHTWNGSQWVHTPPTSEEVASAVRIERDRLLVASDWTQVADAPVDQTAWATYRQELRDVPLQEGFPDSVMWPTRPA